MCKCFFLRWLTVGFTVLVSFHVNAKPDNSHRLDRVVATVNSEAIPESELNQQLQLLLVRLKQTEMNLPEEDVLKKQLLEKLVLEKLQLQIAKEEKVSIDDSSVDETVNQIAGKDNMSVQDLQQYLEEQGVSFKQFRETIKNEMTISKLQQKEVGQFITVSASELDHFLSSPMGQDQTGAEYQVGHILLPLPENPSPTEIQKAEHTAKDLIKKLKNGGDFKQAAMAHSAGPQALNGGELGWRKSPELPTLFARIVPSLPVGEIPAPIKNSSGIHIIKLIDKRIAGTSTLQKTRQEAKVRQILIKPGSKRSDAEAQSLLTQLRTEMLGGEPFAKIATKHSEETNSAKAGGDMGWVSQDTTLPEFHAEIMKLKPGEISQPFKTEMGWHIISISAVRTKHPTNDAIKNRAMDALFQRKFEEQLSVWLKQLRDQAQVESHLNEG